MYFYNLGISTLKTFSLKSLFVTETDVKTQPLCTGAESNLGDRFWVR